MGCTHNDGKVGNSLKDGWHNNHCAICLICLMLSEIGL